MAGVPKPAIAPVAASSAEHTRRRIAFRLLPFVCILYITNYLDRNRPHRVHRRLGTKVQRLRAFNEAIAAATSSPKGGSTLYAQRFSSTLYPNLVYEPSAIAKTFAHPCSDALQNSTLPLPTVVRCQVVFGCAGHPLSMNASSQLSVSAGCTSLA